MWPTLLFIDPVKENEGLSVDFKVTDGVAVLRLDRPKMNAISIQVQADLREAAAELGERDDVRAVVLWGGAVEAFGVRALGGTAPVTPATLFLVAQPLAAGERSDREAPERASIDLPPASMPTSRCSTRRRSPIPGKAPAAATSSASSTGSG